MDEVTPQLWRLLVHEPTADLCVDEVCRSPKLHAEVQRAWPAIQAHAAPCGLHAATQALAALFPVYPPPDRSVEEWAAFWKAYHEDLADLPLEALQAAVKDYRQGEKSEFFPKPGPLRALALKRAEPILKAAYRAKRCAESLPRKPLANETMSERMGMAAKVREALGISKGEA